MNKLAAKVVRMRDKGNLSWRIIGIELDLSPETTRKLYDSVKGEGAHVGRLPLKGGRLPSSPVRRVRKNGQNSKKAA